MTTTAEIPFHVRARDPPKWVSGVNEDTRCSDVVATLAATKKGHHQLRAEDLVLVEQWRGVERVLDPDAKVLKLWRAWGHETPHVKFVLKKTKQQRRSRRRNSMSSSVCGGSDTVHPNKVMMRPAKSSSQLNSEEGKKDSFSSIGIAAGSQKAQRKLQYFSSSSKWEEEAIHVKQQQRRLLFPSIS